MSLNRPLLASVVLAAVCLSTAVDAQSRALTNADVVRLVAMHVSDQTVIAVIHEVKETQFDLNEIAIGYLRASGVSIAVLAAMRREIPATQPPLPAAPTQSPLAAAPTLSPLMAAADAAARRRDKEARERAAFAASPEGQRQAAIEAKERSAAEQAAAVIAKRQAIETEKERTAAGDIANRRAAYAEHEQKAAAEIPATDATADKGQRAQEKSSAVTATSEIEIEVGLVMKAGNVQHVTRTEFFLVRKSVAAVLMENDPEGLSHWAVPGLPNEDMEVASYCTVLRGRGELVFGDRPRRLQALKAAAPIIKVNTVQTVQTDFGGKARFTNVPAGTYWVFGCHTLPPNETSWNVPVVVGAGDKKSVILDQNNAGAR
jgi:hypothetical protein